MAQATTQPTAAKKKSAESDGGDRRELLLDAAIRVIVAQGLRGLTHRAIESEAQVPHGSTTYYFGTRSDLIMSLIRHMAERGRRDVQPIAQALAVTLADRSKPLDIENLAKALVDWLDSAAELELARYELQLAGARDPQIKHQMTDACDIFRQMCVPIAVACGSKDPVLDSQVVQAAVDGWMLNRLTHEHPDDRTMVRGMVALLDGIGACGAAATET